MRWAVVGLVAVATPSWADGLEACGGSTVAFEVLAVNPNKGLVAYKHVSEPVGALDEYVECGYAGMKAHPKAQVVLGIYDVRSRKSLGAWTVYAAAADKAACLSHDTSTKVLNAAKAAFVANGLDLESPPETAFMKANEPATVGGVEVTTHAGEEVLGETPPLEVKHSAFLDVGGKPIHETSFVYERPGAMQGTMAIDQVVDFGATLVVVETRSISHMRGGQVCHDLVMVSP